MYYIVLTMGVTNYCNSIPLSGRQVDLQPQAPCKTKSWWRHFVDTVDIHDLEGICVSALYLYMEA